MSEKWKDYILDSLDLDESYQLPLQGQPYEYGEISAETIRAYFANNIYPFNKRLKARQYFEEKRDLQIELVKLQNWVKETGSKLIIIFEGRDAAGKGSTIKRFMEYLNPRGARVVALEKPDQREAGQWYFQRYVQHLPSAGEIVFFDRSWYNRAGVEKVMGFCSDEEYQQFLVQAPEYERMLVQSGIFIVKFYLSISRQEQAQRFDERATNPLKQWKFSVVDKEAQNRWDDYTQAKEETFRRTDSAEAPWIIVKGEDKLRARLETMRHVLTQFEYAGKDHKKLGRVHPLLVAPVRTLTRFSDN
ncbi:MAG: polyphosphate kinase 2 [bacterium]